MSAVERLTKIFKSAKKIDFDDCSKIVLLSDCHRGDGSWTDDLARNENIYYSALNYYFNNGYIYIELGDGDELWENKEFSVIAEAHKDTFLLLQEFYIQKRFYMLYGNHDIVKQNEKFIRNNLFCYFDSQKKITQSLFEKINPMEALVLQHSQTGKSIFLIHGHQVDFLNFRLWRLARYLVRHFWRRLEAFGINNPTSPAKNNSKKSSVESVLSQWAQKERHILIAGHTHRPVFPNLGEPLYFNDGCCVHPYGVTAIEIAEGCVTLVKWCIGTTQDGLLIVKKEIVAGPEGLQNLFSSVESFT